MKKGFWLTVAVMGLGLMLALLWLTAGGGFAQAAPARLAVDESPDRTNNTPPVADFTIDPPQGVVGTLFFFDHSLSYDAEDSDAWLTFRFDFDGDGSWDMAWDNAGNSPRTFDYSAPATYQVKLEIKDSGGLTDTKVMALQVGDPGSNTAPTARCTVTPASGPPGTVFTFSAATSSDTQDAVSALQVKWDKWGIFDFRGQTWQPATQPMTTSYTSIGLHEVDLIVMDSGYLMDNTSCQVEIIPEGGNQPPTARLSITPTSGTYTTTFTMDVRASTDDHDAIADMSVSFDWTNDGVLDTSWFNASQLWQNTFTYDWGLITVRAVVRDSGGLTDEATQTIYVKPPHAVFLPLVQRK